MKSVSRDSKLTTGYKYGFTTDIESDQIPKGINEKTVRLISSIKKESIYVPSGCANAFLTMSNNTIVHYYMGDSFNPESYRGIRYNDSMFSVDWPCNPKIISDKDLNIPNYMVD